MQVYLDPFQRIQALSQPPDTFCDCLRRIITETQTELVSQSLAAGKKCPLAEIDIEFIGFAAEFGCIHFRHPHPEEETAPWEVPAAFGQVLVQSRGHRLEAQGILPAQMVDIRLQSTRFNQAAQQSGGKGFIPPPLSSRPLPASRLMTFLWAWIQPSRSPGDKIFENEPIETTCSTCPA